MDFNPNIPIYQQIVDEIKRQILVGLIGKGDKISSVRDLALTMQVNPNTMQKALSQLEQEGLLHSERTSGRYVTTNEEVIHKMKANMVAGEIHKFLSIMKRMGYTASEVIQMIRQADHNATNTSN